LGCVKLGVDRKETHVSVATLTINSKNYGAWSLRGWLICRMAGLDFIEHIVDSTEPGVRAELLLLSPSILVPRLEHDGLVVWDTLAITEYLHERFPGAGLLPADPANRAHCRSVCGEMHSGFANLRAALPMNIKARHHDFRLWGGAQADIDRILTIWADCLAAGGGPFLFGRRPTAADAMYAPVCTRFVTYGVEVPAEASQYVEQVLQLPEMIDWITAAVAEPDGLAELEPLEMEF
jgi:glutathione S-transferase